jgi:hypothetical protein
MAVRTARPDVQSLIFRLYCRSVHPELLDACAFARIKKPHYAAEILLCGAGHQVTFRHKAGLLCEVATSIETPLPRHQQVIARRLRGCRSESIRHDAGILYHVSFQVEQLDPEVYMQLHEELLADCARCKLAHQFGSSSRLAPAPLSLVQTEERPGSLLVHAFHTFPDNRAVVKTQSLFEVPGA